MFCVHHMPVENAKEDPKGHSWLTSERTETGVKALKVLNLQPLLISNDTLLERMKAVVNLQMHFR